MTVIELRFEDNTTQILKLAYKDIVMVSKIASDLRKAINKGNEIKCIFSKVYTSKEEI